MNASEFYRRPFASCNAGLRRAIDAVAGYLIALALGDPGGLCAAALAAIAVRAFA